MTSSRQSAGRANPEAGYMLIAVLFLVALILITLAVAAPKMAQSIQRDRELELVHRGEQYKRAIKLYYRKFNAYPSSVDQLENTNQIRFLRKRYTDPMTGKDDWKLIHFGQAHVKPLGLFGQPLSVGGNSTTAGSSVLGGAGPGGIAGASGVTGAGGNSPTGTSGGTFGGTSGTSTTGSAGTSGLYAGGSTTDGSTTGTSGTGTSGTGASGSDAGAFGSSTGKGLGSGTGGTNPTFGGGPIVGIAIPNTKASIKEYKQQKHYNEWEFVYDPIEDQLQAGTMFGGATQNLNGPGTPNGASGFGGGTGTGGGINPTGGIGPGGGTGSGSGSPVPQQ
jgi:type II secretory pathway pseudopilin PulG